MNTDSTIKVRLWQVSGTDKACLFSTTAMERRDGVKVWIPISQIEHVTRREGEGSWKECEVTMQEWVAMKKGLI